MFIGVALSVCVTIVGDRTSVAAPIDTLVDAFTAADGDRTSVETVRDPDGSIKVGVRGDVFDGRRFLKSIFAELSTNDPTSLALNLNIKVATLTGFNGEALHNAELILSRQRGEILEFGVTAKFADDADFVGELRAGRDNRRMIHLEANDAGALFRFLNVYQRIQKGRMSLDIPTSDYATQNGILDVRDFAVVGEPALKPLTTLPQAKRAADAPSAESLQFSRLRVEFKPSAGNVLMIDGIVRGPSVAATATGELDLSNNDIKLRGVVLPFGAVNQALPDFDRTFTYQIAGPLQAPALRVNPIAAVAPGILRKLLAPVSDEK
jgi:hypothetical protein